MRCRITIVGASEVGAEVAARVGALDVADLVLLDSDEGAARRLATQLDDAAAAAGHEPCASGTASWDDAAGSGVVVIAAGDADPVARLVAERCPDAVVVVAAEPVEQRCVEVLALSGFPRARVVGVAGAVEGARLRSLLAGALGVSARDVTALVLGGRGNAAVPVLSATRVAGVPVTDKLPADQVAALVARVRTSSAAGARVAGAAVAEIVAAIVLDRRRVIPCAALCQGELEVENAVAGVPVLLGAGGIERILDVTLDEDERAALAAAAAAR